MRAAAGISKSIAIQAMFKDSVKDIGVFLKTVGTVKTAAFYDTVEFYFDGSPEDIKLSREIIKGNDLKSVFLAAYPMKAGGLNLGDIDSAGRRAVVRQVKEWVDRSYFYGSGRLMVLSGKVYGSERENRRAFEYTAESLREICYYAREKAADYVLTVNLEHFNNTGEPYLLIGPSRTALELAEAVKRDCTNFELTFDLSHVIQLREDPVESLRMLKDHVSHIHLANCVIRDPASPLFGDRHPPFGAKGGETDGVYLYSFLKAAQALGAFSSEDRPVTVGVEIIPPAGSEAAAVFLDATRTFRDCLAGIL